MLSWANGLGAQHVDVENAAVVVGFGDGFKAEGAIEVFQIELCLDFDGLRAEGLEEDLERFAEDHAAQAFVSP